MERNWERGEERKERRWAGFSWGQKQKQQVATWWERQREDGECGLQRWRNACRLKTMLFGWTDGWDGMNSIAGIGDAVPGFGAF